MGDFFIVEDDPPSIFLPDVRDVVAAARVRADVRHEALQLIMRRAIIKVRWSRRSRRSRGPVQHVGDGLVPVVPLLE